MLADQSEKCRELSCSLLSQAVAVIPQPSALLPVLVPALCQRLGVGAAAEPSEEVRLRLVRLLAALAATAGSTLVPHLPNVTSTICSALSDPFPDIKKVRWRCDEPDLHDFCGCSPSILRHLAYKVVWGPSSPLLGVHTPEHMDVRGDQFPPLLPSLPTFGPSLSQHMAHVQCTGECPHCSLQLYPYRSCVSTVRHALLAGTKLACSGNHIRSA